MRSLLLAWIILSSFAAFAQSDTTLLSDEELKNSTPYTDLKKALKEPEKVIVLDLSGQQLEELPESIGSFTNLQALYLGCGIKKSTPKRVLKKASRIGGGIMHLDRGTGKYINYNRIAQLPDTLASLKKLQKINLNNNGFEEVPEVLTQLPNIRWINLYGCYGLIHKEEELKALKAALPANCLLYTDVRLEEKQP